MRQIKIKLVVLGDSGTGKSSILNQYVNNNYIRNNLSTIGVDFFKKTVYKEDNKFEICIWDTSGQEKFSSIVSSYYRNISAILLVFDISNYTSFKNLKKWLREIDEFCNDDIIIRLIGNKSDVNISRHEVSKRDINLFCKVNNLIYEEVSAKNNINIDASIDGILDEVDRKLIDGTLKPDKKNGIKVLDTFTLYDEPETKKKCCIIL